MSNGQITESTILVLAGLIGIVVIASIVLAFVLQIRKLTAEQKEKQQEAVDKAKAEAKKETASEIAFNRLAETVYAMDKNMNASLTCMRESFDIKTSGIDRTLLDHTRQIVALEASAKQAHKRIDEHRQVDHGIRNGNGHSEINLQEV